MKVLLVLAALLLLSVSAHQVGQLYVLQTTPNLPLQSQRETIQPEHVAGILSNLMGLTAAHPLPEVSLPAGGFLRQPKTNLLMVVEGAPATPELNSLASFDVHSDSAETPAELLNRMFSGNAFDSEINLASVGDLLCQIHANSLILSVSSNTGMLGSLALNSQLLRSNPNWNVYSALVNLQASTVTMDKRSEQSALKKVLEEILSTADLDSQNVFESGSPVFDLAIKEDKAFLVEVNLASKLLEALRQSTFAPLLADSNPDLITLVSSSLVGIREKYGMTSQKYTLGWKKLSSVLAEIKESFGNEGLFHVLLVEGEADSTGLIRNRRSIQKRDHTSPVSHCFSSLEACNSTTNACSSQGTCTLIKFTTTGTRHECYRCKCNAEYAGESCEYINIVAPFHMIFWVSLTIIIVLYLVAYGLAYMDPGTDTLLFRTVTKTKKE